MMKYARHAKILEIIKKYDVETQEELAVHLVESGYPATQATVSRDIRELKLTKVSSGTGRQKYAAIGTEQEDLAKYIRVFRAGFQSMDMAQNILVIKTVAGMAMAVAAALDAMECHEIVGSIAGDDTIMCAIRSVEDTGTLMERLHRIISAES